MNPNLTIGEIMIKIDPILDKVSPDAMLILGDTNSCLSAIAAKKKRYLSFTTKQVTDVLTSEFLKKQIEDL